jgi:hypothetical protein
MDRYTFVVVFLEIEEIRLSATEDPDGLSEADAAATVASASSEIQLSSYIMSSFFVLYSI